MWDTARRPGRFGGRARRPRSKLRGYAIDPAQASSHTAWTAGADTEGVSLDVTGLALTLTDARDVTCFAYTYDMLGRQLHADGVDNGLRWALPDGAGRPWLSWRGDDLTGDPGFRNRATYDAMGRPVARWQKRDGTSSDLCRSLTIYGERKSDAVAHNRLGAVWRQYDEGGATVVNEYDFKGVPQITARRLITFVAERDPDTAEFWDFDSDWSAIAAATTEAAIDTADAAAALETTTWSSQSLVDALGRLYLTETPTAAGGTPVVQHLQYDDGGALAEVEVTDRASTQTQVHGLRYNARGQRTQVEHGNGVTTTFTYDEVTFRLTQQMAERSDASMLQDLRLTWGPAGQIYAIRDGIQTLVYYDNEITHPERQFVYDARGRLIRATGREHASTYGLDPAAVPSTPCSIPGPANQVSGYIRDYEWDAAGNMTELSVVGGWTRSLVYESVSNRLKTFTWSSPSTTTNYITYDQFGQMEGLPSAKDLRWDGDGNLRYSSPLTTGATTRTWYQYSGAQRVRKVTEKEHATGWYVAKETIYLDGGFEVYRTYDAPGTLELEREHVRITDGAGHALEIETVLVEGGSAVSTITPLYRYSLVDQIGSVCVELDQAAAVVSYEEYHPFGTTAYYGDTRGAQAKRYRYSGKEQDAETGLYYYGYRYYAAGVARWTVPDPAGTLSAVNLYQCFGAEPVGRRDLLGLDDESFDQLRDSAAHAMTEALAEQPVQREWVEPRVREALNLFNDRAVEMLVDYGIQVGIGDYLPGFEIDFPPTAGAAYNNVVNAVFVNPAMVQRDTPLINALGHEFGHVFDDLLVPADDYFRPLDLSEAERRELRDTVPRDFPVRLWSSASTDWREAWTAYQSYVYAAGTRATAMETAMGSEARRYSASVSRLLLIESDHTAEGYASASPAEMFAEFVVILGGGTDSYNREVLAIAAPEAERLVIELDILHEPVAADPDILATLPVLAPWLPR